MIKGILKFITGAASSLSLAGLGKWGMLLVGALAVLPIYSLFVKRPLKKANERLTEQIAVVRDSVANEAAKVGFLQEGMVKAKVQYDSLEVDLAELASAKRVDSINFVSRERQLQLLTKRQNQEKLLLKNEIENLEKGVRVDLVNAQLNWTGKKLKGCEYINGYAYGEPVLNVCDTLRQAQGRP